MISQSIRLILFLQFGLSQDPEILSLIKNKHIFFVGKHHSLQYLLDGGAIKSSSLDNAEGVVLAAATKEAHELVPAINWAKNTLSGLLFAVILTAIL